MKINTIYKDNEKEVKSVFYGEKFLYTITYIYDAEGCVNKMIRVFYDGFVDIQE